MNLKYWDSIAYLVAMMSSLAFETLLIFAMCLYPGGTYNNPDSIGYTFFGNLISDLTMPVSHSGRSNHLSNMVYFFAMIQFSIGQTLFVAATIKFFNAKDIGKKWIIIAAICALSSIIVFIVLIFYPINAYYSIHWKLIELLLILVFCATTIYSVAIYKNKDYPTHFVVLFVIFAILIAINIVMYLIFPEPELSFEELLVFSVMQEVMIFFLIFCIQLLSYGFWKIISAKRKPFVALKYQSFVLRCILLGGALLVPAIWFYFRYNDILLSVFFLMLACFVFGFIPMQLLNMKYKKSTVNSIYSGLFFILLGSTNLIISLMENRPFSFIFTSLCFAGMGLIIIRYPSVLQRGA
ncbi:MAG: hypothetical protein ACTSWN_04430 [Promethearchaeota archaeon]